MARTRVVGYTRISPRPEAGVSLEAQRAKLRAYADLYDLEFVDIIEDRLVSGKTLDRTGLREALEMLKDGRADGILVAKLDRLTRSVRDLGELVEMYFADGKWALISVAETVDRVLALRASGMSIRAVASALEEEGRPTKSGGRWHPTTVQRILARERGRSSDGRQDCRRRAVR